jgi:hypothetical protein
MIYYDLNQIFLLKNHKKTFVMILCNTLISTMQDADKYKKLHAKITIMNGLNNK